MAVTQHRQRRRNKPRTVAAWLDQARRVLVGTARLCSPTARGVYHPQPSSPIVLGAALLDDVDLDALERRLWWRGLGIVRRDGQTIAGADVTAAAHARRMKLARSFVTRQLRDAGVRGAVRRWML